MRKITHPIFIFAIVFFAGLSGLAQSPPTAKAPLFDAELAKKLGADKNGMKNYVLAILKTGPKDADIKGKEREDMFKGHMANIKRLADEGKLAVAGPFGKNDLAFRGLFILNAATLDDAKKLTDTDPVIRSGMMIVELIPWYGSAALMQTNEIHGKIAEMKF
ncbi:MAG: YciI family protein [Pyrinomonadaceae bacterium]